MKIEKLLVGLFASFLMVGCSQNDDAPNGGEEQGKNKDSYVSVNIVARTNASRAATSNGFGYGKTYENQVNCAHFFFFNSDGSAYELQSGTADYQVSESENSVSGTATNNWLYFASFNDGEEKSGDSADSIEEVVSAVLIFKGKSSEAPAKVVAVLNLDNTLLTSNNLDLSTLSDLLVEEAKAFSIDTENNETTGNFVMSNSVYATGENNTTVMNATDITNMAKSSAEEALKNPVNINVERLAVKVTVTNNITETVESEVGSNSSNIAIKNSENENFTIGSGENAKQVYAKIKGWDLNTTISESYLLKDITNASSTWGSTDKTWNDDTSFRSYWAGAVPMTEAVTYKKSFSWHGLTNKLGKDYSDYCLENVSESNQTKILVAAQLVDENGQALTIAQWMANYYIVEITTTGEGESQTTTKNWESGLLTAVANSLNLYKKNETATAEEGETNQQGYTKITPQDIKVVPKYNSSGTTASTNAHDYYKVDFAFKQAGTWYKGTGTGENVTVNETDKVDVTEESVIPGVVSAKVWQDGATYYFTNIEHFNGKDAVIRNHHYVVNITGAVGLGTPVYYPDGYTPNGDNTDIPEIPDPVIPSDDETYLSAQINILSWKLVSNDVTLGQ